MTVTGAVCQTDPKLVRCDRSSISSVADSVGGSQRCLCLRYLSTNTKALGGTLLPGASGMVAKLANRRFGRNYGPIRLLRRWAQLAPIHGDT